MGSRKTESACGGIYLGGVASASLLMGGQGRITTVRSGLLEIGFRFFPQCPPIANNGYTTQPLQKRTPGSKLRGVFKVSGPSLG